MPSVINATTANGVTVQGDNSGSLQLATNNGTTAVTIDTSQNVGIGTASPGGYKLAVGDGSGNRGRIMLKGATSGNYPEINIDDSMNTSGKNYQIYSTGGHLKFANQTDGALVSFVANAFGIGLADNAPVDGDGIRFPATQNPSSNANTLDDYEEGTWTPVLTTTGSAPTGIGYEFRSATYTKIGNRVIARFGFKLNAISSVGSGEITVTGLPFTSFNYGSWQQDCFAVKAAYFVSAATIENGLVGWVQDASTQVYFRTGNNDGSVAASQIQSTTAIGAVIVYQVS